MPANLQLSTKDGEVSIKLELKLGRPGYIKPGHPAGAPHRRRPRRHRGPAAKERSRQRVASFQASQASPGASSASHGAARAPTQAVDQTQEAPNSPGKTSDKPAAPRLLEILESPLESAQRRKITTLKRDVKIPSFNQVDGLLSSPTAERKAEVEMEEVEKKEKEEEEKVEGEEEKKNKEMMQPGSAGSSLVACITDPTSSTSGFGKLPKVIIV